MKECTECKSPEIESEIVKSLDSHNNVIKYSCKKCGFSDTKIEPIDKDLP